jgi:hypothetical protein
LHGQFLSLFSRRRCGGCSLGLPLQMTSNGTQDPRALTFSFFSLILLCAMGTERARDHKEPKHWLNQTSYFFPSLSLWLLTENLYSKHCSSPGAQRAVDAKQSWRQFCCDKGECCLRLCLRLSLCECGKSSKLFNLVCLFLLQRKSRYLCLLRTG